VLARYATLARPKPSTPHGEPSAVHESVLQPAADPDAWPSSNHQHGRQTAPGLWRFGHGEADCVGCSCTPSTAFLPTRAPGYWRFCFALPVERAETKQKLEVYQSAYARLRDRGA